jgi:hypothetical protein
MSHHHHEHDHDHPHEHEHAHEHSHSHLHTHNGAQEHEHEHHHEHSHSHDHHDHEHQPHDHEHHDHHHHPTGHEHEKASPVLSEQDKLGKMVAHWIQHNEEHARSYREWALKAQDMGLAEVRGLLEEVADETHRQNEGLGKILSVLGKKMSSD